MDNASKDRSRVIARGIDSVEVVANPENVGYGRACNQGVALAGERHILILNPDVEISSVDAVALATRLSQPRLGLLGPAFVDGDSHNLRIRHWAIDTARHIVGPLRPRLLPFRRGPLLPGEVSFPSGAALLVARAEFVAVGGFNPAYFLYYEDADLALRYRGAGLPVSTLDAIRARHYSGTSAEAVTVPSHVRNGWEYLAWLEFLVQWHGTSIANIAATSTRLARRSLIWILDELLGFGLAPSPLRRKLDELRALERFVSLQTASGEGLAAEAFCRSARELLGARGQRNAGFPLTRAH